MRQLTFILILVLLLTGCTREIIRENTIIKDSTPALEVKLNELKEKVDELETKLAGYESAASIPQQGNVIIVPQVLVNDTSSFNAVQPEEIPPAPLNTSLPASPTPETVVQESNQSAQTRAEINELLEKASSRVKSYSFIYAFQSTKLSGSTFYIKDNKMKIKLKSTDIYNFEDFFDTVYLDLTLKTAKGYCENTGIEACRKGINEYNLSYEEYKIKTPSDWLNELKFNKDKLEFKGESILFERNVVFLQNNNTFVWVDEFSGLPLRVKIKKEAFEEVHDYRHLSLNYLSDKDVIKS